VLFTGDLPAENEPDIIPDCDILKVAHHGAENATSARFLAASTPEIAVISVGENSHNHPRPEVVERLTDCGAEVLRTDTRGMITATLSNHTWQISTFIEAEHEVE
jgi:competence protein ComEC